MYFVRITNKKIILNFIVSMAVYFMLDKELKAEKSKNTIQLSSEIKENI